MEPKELETKNPLSDFFDDETVNNLNLFKKQTELDDITKLMSTVEDTVNKPLIKANTDKNVEEIIEYLDEILSTYTVDQLKEMTAEQIDSIYRADAENEGIEYIDIDMSTDGGKSEFEMKRDYLIFRKESFEASKGLKDSVKELNEYLAGYKEDIEKLYGEFGSMDIYLMDVFNKKIEDSTDSPEKIELYTKIRNAYIDSFTLENLTAYVKSYKGKNILGDFLDSKRARKIYNKYMKLGQKLDIYQDLTKFALFESYLYDENQIKEKKIRMNIFAFSLIHYIASTRYDELDKFDGIFMSQVVVNMKNIIYNNFPDSENTFKFMDAARNIVEIIG